MDNRRFGAFVAERRKELGMTQGTLAERLHVTDKAVSRWERGVGTPDIGTLEPLAEALEVSLLELLRSERTETVGPGEAEGGLRSLLQLAGQELRKRKKGQLLAALLAAALTIFGMAGLYRMEFSVEVLSDNALEAAIDRYSARENMDVEVLERLAVGNRLFVLYVREDKPGEVGFAELERGPFGGYRFLNSRRSSDPLLQVYVHRGKVAGKYLLLIASAYDLPGAASFSLYYDAEYVGDPILEETMEKAPFLRCFSFDDPIDVGLAFVRYYDAGGTEIPWRTLYEAVPHPDESYGTSTTSMELGLIWFWEGLVLGLGVIFVRYFLDGAGPRRREEGRD